MNITHTIKTESKFLTSYVPAIKNPTSTHTIVVRVENASTSFSNGIDTLSLSTFPKESKMSYTMPGFPDSLLSAEMLCDEGLHFTITKHKVIVHDPATLAIMLQGWHHDSSLWISRPEYCKLQSRNPNNR